VASSSAAALPVRFRFLDLSEGTASTYFVAMRVYRVILSVITSPMVVKVFRGGVSHRERGMR
jgi:hypothetical protein